MSRIGGGNKRRRRVIGVGAKPRRPVRWIEGNSAHGAEPLPVVTSFFFTPSIDTSAWPTGGGTELVFGDDDLDWMDANEATVERVVGDLNVLGFNVQTSGPDTGYLAFIPFRMGLLLVEEVEDISTWVPPSLWDRESLEEYEWMWLWQSMARDVGSSWTNLTPGGDRVTHLVAPDMHLDVHVRRKMGKKDHLVLLGQFGLDQNLDSTMTISCNHLIRVLMKTK